MKCNSSLRQRCRARRVLGWVAALTVVVAAFGITSLFCRDFARLLAREDYQMSARSEFYSVVR